MSMRSYGRNTIAVSYTHLGTTENYIHLEKVSKIYGTKEVKIIAVDEISFNIAKGEFADVYKRQPVHRGRAS